MCLAPVKILNPKKRVSLQGGHQFYIEVPCGQCAECKEAARNEWYFRSYYEAQDTFDSGGYIYFDTLTYKDEELPHISEFISVPKELDNSCFDVEDYRYFFVRLRRAMNYLGVKVEHNLKYFLTSEYGTSENGTHRPHYHILFFVKNNIIDPLVLSKLVYKCWNKGRTDGIDFHPYHYVMKHVFGPRYNSDMIHLQMVCNYVSKYITKSSHFEKIVEDRLNNIFIEKYKNILRRAGVDVDSVEEKYTIEDVFNDDASEEWKDRYKLLKKNMSQFHRQSHGFGENFLKYNDYNEVFKTGMISMPDKNNIVKHIPLPSYYQMKIFYDLQKDFSGRAHWELNEEGKKYKLVHRMKSIEIMATKIKDWLDCMKGYNYYCDSNNKEWYDSIWKKFESLNGDRDLIQFALYLLIYKGRVKSPAQREREVNGVYRVDDVVEFFVGSMDELKQFGPQLYFYGTKTDRKLFGTKFVTDKWLGDIYEYRGDEGIDYTVKNWFDKVSFSKYHLGYAPNIFKHKKDGSFGHLCTPDFFASKYVINDNADERFKHYDEMYDLYCRGQYWKNKFKQDGFNEKEDVKFRLKQVTKRTI